MASIAASLMLSGVSKSGSPAPRPIMSRPAAFSSRALLVTAMVGEGFTRSSVPATSMSISSKMLQCSRLKRAHPKQGRDCPQALWRKKPEARDLSPRPLWAERFSLKAASRPDD